MKKPITILIIISILCSGISTGCGKNKENSARKEIAILENEKWWGGAVLDGRNSPLGDGFAYNQEANCKANQAAPLFLSDKGRFIWSEKPLNIVIANGQDNG